MHHHATGLRRLLTADGMPPEEQATLVTALTADELPPQLLAPADHALVRYAEKLTRTPWAIDAADLTALRDAGFDDRAIHDACAIVAYFAFVNRIADGLGVELESEPPRNAG